MLGGGHLEAHGSLSTCEPATLRSEGRQVRRTEPTFDLLVLRTYTGFIGM